MAITYGMSVKEFWDDEPDLFWAYRFSYYQRLKYDSELFNQKAWLQGAYIYNGVSVAICNALSKQKQEYPKVPYGEKEQINTEKQSEKLTAQIKNRVLEIQNLFKGTSKEGNTTNEVVKNEN